MSSNVELRGEPLAGRPLKRRVSRRTTTADFERIDMKEAELIARQAKQIEELRDEVSNLKERARRARLHIYCIGGPLNDNKLGYSKPQMVTFARIADELGDE